MEKNRKFAVTTVFVFLGLVIGGSTVGGCNAPEETPSPSPTTGAATGVPTGNSIGAKETPIAATMDEAPQKRPGTK